MTATTGPHILVFPFPAQGHMIPLLDLTHQLALHGLTITVLVTPKNLSVLTPLLSTHPTSIQPLVFPFPSHPSLPPDTENFQHLPVSSFPAFNRSFAELSNPILHWFNTHLSPPIAIISDFFLGWTQQLAIQLGIKRIVFSASGALVLSILNSIWRDLPKRNDKDGDNTLVYFPDIPYSPKYPISQLSTVFRCYTEGDSDLEFFRDGMRQNPTSWGIVLNSFTELESVYLDHMKKNELKHERVFAVGPLLPILDGTNTRGGSSSVEVNHLLSWLDTCPDKSVIYICFGSQVVLTNQQIEELAKGLEKSEARFVWCVKQPRMEQSDGQYGVVPTGFEDRVAGKGFVIKGWAPQVVILNHRAVGSFLTHCGWNSVLEAIIAGVPMLTWPMGADQFINADLLVDQIGVGVRVCEGASTVPNADELAQKVAESVGMNRIVSEKAKEMSQAASNAVKEGGSSYEDLVGLVRELHVLGDGIKESTTK